MAKIHIAVLRGGPSQEYDVSLKSGGAVISALSSDDYAVHDVLISHDGTWYLRGMPKTESNILSKMDIVFNAMHGNYGEDGGVQRILDMHNIPYTGSGVFASAIAMDKARTKEILGRIDGIKFAESIALDPSKVYDLDKETKKIFEQFSAPYIIKPRYGGSSNGLYKVDTVRELPDALEKSLKQGPVIVEEFVEGIEATCGVLEDFRNEMIYALPLVEIRPKTESGLFDRESKYNGETEEICPGNFPEETKRIIQKASVDIHEKLKLRHYSRSDFIVSKKGIYFLEVNTLPGLTSESLFPKSADAIGLNFESLLGHLLKLALRR